MTCVYLKFLIYILIGNSCAVSENIHSQPMKKKKPFCFKGKCDSNLEKFPEGQGLKPKKKKKPSWAEVWSNTMLQPGNMKSLDHFKGVMNKTSVIHYLQNSLNPLPSNSPWRNIVLQVSSCKIYPFNSDSKIPYNEANLMLCKLGYCSLIFTVFSLIYSGCLVRLCSEGGELNNIITTSPVEGPLQCSACIVPCIW